MPEIRYKGQSSVSTLGGQIKLEQNRGRLVVYDPETQRELNVVDRQGYTFSDATVRRIRIGSSPNDDRVGIWVSKPTIDVITQLGG